MKELHYTSSIILLFITILIREIQFRTIVKKDSYYMKKDIHDIWNAITEIRTDIKNILKMM